MADVGQRTLGNLWDWTSNIGQSPTEYMDAQNPIHADMETERLSIQRMNDERAARRADQMLGNMQPQGVTRPRAQSYGSEAMYNYTPGARPSTAQHQRMLNEQLEGRNISETEKQTLNTGKDYRNIGGIINQGATGIDSSAKGTAALVRGPSAAEEERAAIENSEAYTQFHGRPENKGMQPIRVGSSVGYRDPNYIGASPTSYGSPFGEYQTTRPQQLGQSAKWHSSMKDKPLVMRDMRDPAQDRMSMRRAELAQNSSANVNDVGKFGSNQSLGTNQTSDSQLANNGNINNPKITNKPAANGSNGFF